MKIPILLLSFLSIHIMNAQQTTSEELPYHKIPEPAETYTAGTVVSRMIDGLGFRYYWATNGLTQENLDYKPTEENRTISETIDHLYNLALTILNSANKEPNDRTVPRQLPNTFEEKRKLTLFNLEKASKIFASVTDLKDHKVIFKNKQGTAEFPFWNQINGPIEDAVWHSGQVVVMRRASGNPIDPGVSVFLGIKRDN